ncbi:5-bromo-4-chloroindolyl phosphate hydrolysis family protein [uncultured Eubacterium sp.]|uniref:5-bromo-4-chloroindolyl phosphate hydrolysis family protein n=1 Tax=uncultured Eubacterium sp. TaxID=165185 RepID=UPI002592094E|nr:5-bromo-4-chloroindolyl phosphate hydrolysis family protein [uncultured Eubacterium sp.]
MSDTNWNDVGDKIKDAVDSAISTGDFSNLSCSIGDVINDTIDNVKGSVKTAAQQNKKTYSANPYYKTIHTGSAPDQPQPPALYNKRPGGQAGAIISMALGYSVGIFTLAGVISFIALSAAVSHMFLVPLIIFGVLTVGGFYLGTRGTKKIRLLNRYRSYVRQIDHRLSIPIQQLADRAHKSVSFVAKDLQNMIDQRLFYEAHVDTQDNYFLLSDQAYEDYRSARLEYYEQKKIIEKEQEEHKVSDECQKLIDEGQSYIRHIRECNDDIPGEEISRKLDKMEQLVQRIFDEVRIHPEVAPDLQKMMDYYLPTTSKLLDAYRELDKQPVAGDNIRSTKAEIEQTVDTLNVAFEKLLDSLFADRAWDISSDISVLNTMLAQEGLKEDDFTLNNK